MSIPSPELIDQLARVYVQAIVDALLTDGGKPCESAGKSLEIVGEVAAFATSRRPVITGGPPGRVAGGVAGTGAGAAPEIAGGTHGERTSESLAFAGHFKVART